MRKLATIRKIDAVNPIDGADAIEVCTIGGWKVVTKKSEFVPGDLCIYLEIDSWIPNAIAPFLSKGHAPREFNGVKGERLRTAKMRGQISQGLVLPISVLADNPDSAWGNPADYLNEDFDVSEILNIQKWEPHISPQLAGKVMGLFPSFIPKTDQERIQNLSREMIGYKNYYWEVTEKLDGASMTVYVNNEKSGVCSRNYDLDPNASNSFWEVAIRERLMEKIRSTGRNLALQGELIGPNVQKNRYKRLSPEFWLFDVYDIDRSRYLLPLERLHFAMDAAINHVPTISSSVVISGNIEEMLREAEGKSRLCAGVEREGLVYKSFTSDESFKVISNKFLLKEE
jgi:RNA ligase (TIGR02306 family)